MEMNFDIKIFLLEEEAKQQKKKRKKEKQKKKRKKSIFLKSRIEKEASVKSPNILQIVDIPALM